MLFSSNGMAKTSATVKLGFFNYGKVVDNQGVRSIELCFC